MDEKLLITGLPRCGKSTLISKLMDYYTHEKNYVIHGFLTPEVKKNRNRIGFNIIDIYSKNIYQLARAGDFKSKYKVGKYNVFVKELEEYLENSLDLGRKIFDLIIIDEIGKMELFSKKFQNLIKKAFSSNKPIIATIGLKLQHPLKNYLINLPSVQLLKLNRQNSQLIFERVISIIT